VSADPVENVGDSLFHIMSRTPRGACKKSAASAVTEEPASQVIVNADALEARLSKSLNTF
jgi:hypothetical protein